MKTDTAVKPQTHTPTPWNLGERINWFIYAVGNPLHRIAETCKTPDNSVLTREANANAAFIVRAVNAHDELVWQLKSAQAWIENASNLLTPDQRGFCGYHSTQAAREAIAKAEGR